MKKMTVCKNNQEFNLSDLLLSASKRFNNQIWLETLPISSKIKTILKPTIMLVKGHKTLLQKKCFRLMILLETKKDLFICDHNLHSFDYNDINDNKR